MRYNNHMRIAIVGGTFSPPHNGHVALALCARDGLKADRVLIMPNAAPSHKFCGVSKLDRREMTRLAFMDVKKTELDETELFSDGKSYTYETMAKLKALYPNDDLIFVIGGDSLRDFATWRHPDRILKNCRLAVAARRGVDLSDALGKTEKEFGTEIELLDMPFCDVSSTLVRVNCNFGFDNSAYLPRPVDAYIKEKGLYCDFKPMVTKLRALQNRDRFEHTYNVVLAGLEIARKTNLDESEVFVACLLHDCAKNIPCSEWRRYGFDNGENLLPPIVHCGLGVKVAERVFGITDARILDAIRFHTTCRPDMTQLDKLVFVADKVELTRNYPELKENYSLALSDLDAAFLTVLSQTYRLACKKHGAENVDEMTRRAMNYYFCNTKQEK